MKTIYLSFLLSAFSISLIAQLKPRPAAPVRSSVEANILPVMESIPANVSTAPRSQELSPIQARPKSMSMWQQVIGLTNYDNQSNNSMQDRVIVDNEDKVHATWTLSFGSSDDAYEDRGTGYNSGEGYIWGEEPYERLEDIRTGWPALIKTADNKEIIFCHAATGPLVMMQRSTIGSGAWTTGTVPSDLGTHLLWPKAFVDGNNIHLIAIGDYTASGGVEINGVDGNLIYWRSEDNGQTWAVQDHYFPEIDGAEFSRLDGDAYSIHARDGKVSIGVYNEFHDTFLLHSDDNGDNWSYTLISDFPIAGYEVDSITDIENDGIVDTVFTTDGCGAIHIDESGVTHCFFGSSFIFDAVAGDSLYSYFVTDDLLYWNSTFDTDSIYTVALPEENIYDEDEEITITAAQSPKYRTSLACMPTVAEDSDGTFYLVYAAADEEYIGVQVYRHLYVKTTTDFDTWTDPVELTPDVDFDGYEYVFPTMYRTVDEQLHLTAMRDTEPGLIVQGDLDPANENEIIYLSITKDLDISDAIVKTPAGASFNAYPNPTSGMITIEGGNFENQVLRVFNAMGQEVVSTKFNKNLTGNDKATFDFSFLPAGVYTVTVGTGENKTSREIIIRK